MLDPLLWVVPSATSCQTCHKLGEDICSFVLVLLDLELVCPKMLKLCTSPHRLGFGVPKYAEAMYLPP